MWGKHDNVWKRKIDPFNYIDVNEKQYSAGAEYFAKFVLTVYNRAYHVGIKIISHLSIDNFFSSDRSKTSGYLLTTIYENNWVKVQHLYIYIPMS